MSPFRRTLLCSSILLALTLFVKWATAIPRSKLPPGPKGIPFFGNVYQVGRQPWYTFTEWKKIYGPMVYLNMAGQPMLILNDYRVAADLLDRRASIYSDRPRNIVAGEILTGGLLLPFLRFGDLWRRMRRAAHEALNTTSAPKYHRIQESEAIILANDFMKDPEHWKEHVHRATASVTTSLVYDMPPLKSISDPAIVTVKDMIIRAHEAMLPGAHLVEYIPMLKYLPRAIAKWKRESQDRFLSYSKVFISQYTEIRTRVLSGEDQRPSFCASLAESSTRHNLTTLQASWLAADLFVAGADTTAMAFTWLMFAMIAFPDIQRKAQAELDEVVGRERPPSFSDWDHLPYTRAVIKEALRWRTAIPLGVSHASVQDDWYEGYFIPKGTICIPNVWAMNKDTSFFGPDAADFNPSRHLDEQGKLKTSPDTKDEGHFGFGFGRRVCVGRTVANYSSFIYATTILWAFTLQPGKDANGKCIQPDPNASKGEGVSSLPPPFTCTITPRAPDVESILAQTKDERLEKRDTSTRKDVKPIMTMPSH